MWHILHFSCSINNVVPNISKQNDWGWKVGGCVYLNSFNWNVYKYDSQARFIVTSWAFSGDLSHGEACWWIRPQVIAPHASPRAWQLILCVLEMPLKSQFVQEKTDGNRWCCIIETAVIMLAFLSLQLDLDIKRLFICKIGFFNLLHNGSKLRDCSSGDRVVL